MRSEGDAVMTAIDETLRIGKEAHIPVEIWHLKVAGKQLGTHARCRRQTQLGTAQGMDVTADTYAYPAWSNDFSAFIPPGARRGDKAD